MTYSETNPHPHAAFFCVEGSFEDMVWHMYHMIYEVVMSYIYIVMSQYDLWYDLKWHDLTWCDVIYSVELRFQLSGGIFDQSGMVTLQELEGKPLHRCLHEVQGTGTRGLWEGPVLGFGSLGAWLVSLVFLLLKDVAIGVLIFLLYIYIYIDFAKAKQDFLLPILDCSIST